jgi:hypothetical protein
MPTGVAAGATEEASFWEQRTCHTRGSRRICSSLSLRFSEDWNGPGTGLFLIGALTGPGISGPNPILASAVGVLANPGIDFDPDNPSGPAGWGGGPPARWTVPSSKRIAFSALGAYSLVAGSGANNGIDHWPAVLEGQVGEEIVWTWEGPRVKDFLFVWRGESEDGSVDFDCWQDPRGGEECLSTMTPEPSTAVLLLTGLAGLAIILRRHRSVLGRG